jgi:hypothetical protein
MGRNTKLAKEFTEHFSRAVNMFLSKEELEEMAEMIVNDHPTLQQNKMRLFMVCLSKWAKKAETEMYDLRSEATCKTAKKMLDALEEGDLYFPTV